MSAEDTLAGLQLVDHHCHGVVAGDLDRDAFESFINEGFDRPASGTSHFDTPIGLAVRRWCAPVLDLEPFVPAETYVTKRLELGAREVNQRFLGASGLQALFLDSGYRSDEILAFESSARSPASSRARSFASRALPRGWRQPDPDPRITRTRSRRRSRPLPGTPWG